MPISRANIAQAIKLLGKEEAKVIWLAAEKIERLEASWAGKLKDVLEEYDVKVATSLLNTGNLPLDIDFTEFYFEHSMEVMREAVTTAERQRELTSKKMHLSSAPPPPKLPKNMAGLQKIWDLYRKTGKVPRRVKSLADKVKKAYLDKCQSVWDKHSSEFRTGNIGTQQDAVKVIRRASDGVYARAKMIVETETTNYYNQTRRKVYDQSPEVSHYLFLAIRDQATTKWCKTRHRLVYQKGKAVTDRETPAIHWNCRSEMVPLTKLNPRHAAIIADKSNWRENRRPEPLPKDWSK